MENKKTNGIAIKMRKINVSNNFFIYIPEDVMKGIYREDENIFQDELTAKLYQIASDEYLNYSEEDYGYLHALSLENFKELYVKDNDEKEAIIRYFKLYSNQVFITGYVNDQKINKTMNIENFLSKNTINQEKVFINIEELKEQQYNNIIHTLKKITPNTNTRVLQNIYDKISVSLPRYQEINDLLMEKLGIEKDDIEIDKIEGLELTEEIEENVQGENPNIEKIYNKKEIEESIKKIVKGQNEHVDRITTEILKLELTENQKTGILLTGSTGVGKTKIISLLANKLNRPFLLIDTTQLTVPGYVGKNIEDFLYDLYVQEKSNKERVENAIVVFDEIDKKGSSSNADVSGKGVLNTLLKFLDGTYYTLKNNKNISTNNMTVIAAGAFASVYKSPESGKGPLGFNSNKDNSKITIDDFIDKGGMPDEFMGRFPIFIRLNDLKEKDLKEILLQSAESPIKLEQSIFNKVGVNLVIDDSYIDAVAKSAYEKHTGARSLQSIVKETTWRPFKEVTDYYGTYQEVKLTANTAINPEEFELVAKEQIDEPKIYALRNI